MADDRYEIWLTEKLWEMIPAFYRHEDGVGENPGVLRGLVEVMAAQGAELRRSQDRLWADQYVETADDWAVPYIAGLVATRLVSALNARGRRVDVAKSIYYRRRSGTLRVLEELARDIATWESKVVESFRRLARSWHGLDDPPDDLAGRFRGRFSSTPPGGTADLRRPIAAEAAGTAFDEYHYLPDLRRPRGRVGRYGISRLAFHLYRLRAYRIEDADPVRFELPSGGVRFSFDPSGRDVPLFSPAARPERWDDWISALEWELPTPLRCRILAHASYTLTDATLGALRDDLGVPAAEADDLLPLRGASFHDEASLRAVLGSAPFAASFDPPTTPDRFRTILRSSIDEETGKAFLCPAHVAVDWEGAQVARHDVKAGSIEDPSIPPWTPWDLHHLIAVDPERGRFAGLGVPGEATAVTYNYGFPGPFGAGPYARKVATRTRPVAGGGTLTLDDAGVVEITDNRTYDDVQDRLTITGVTLQAADGRRPYLRLSDAWTLGAAGSDAELVLDGVWIGGSGAARVVLDGDWETVTIRSSTLDPGGADAGGGALAAVVLEVAGNVESLVIDRSVLAGVRTTGTGRVERLEARDSVVAGGPAVPAFDLPDAELHLDRVTATGGVFAARLDASEALLVDDTQAADPQWGCVRFSAYLAGSRIPRAYESHARDDFRATFTSRRFGDPGFFQLAETAAPELHDGAENGAEIGAYNSLLNTVKADGLAAKVDEFSPFGRIPAYIDET